MMNASDNIQIHSDRYVFCICVDIRANVIPKWQKKHVFAAAANPHLLVIHFYMIVNKSINYTFSIFVNK